MKPQNDKSIIDLSTSDVKSLYNIFKIVRAKDLPNLSKTYKDNLKILVVLMKRKNRKPPQPPKWFTTYMDAFEKKIDKKIYDAINNPPQPPKWFTTYMDGFRKEIYEYINNPPQPPKWFRDFVEKQFKPEIKSINVRLDNLESLVISQFKAHGWIK